MKTKQEIAAYIPECQKGTSDFEKRAWFLLAMWNDTRQQEGFLGMLMNHWLDAKCELAKPPDDFHESHLRDEKVCGSLLTWLGVDLTSISKEGEYIHYSLTDEYHG